MNTVPSADEERGRNMVLDRFRTPEKEMHAVQVSDLCKRRLLGYAETFHELARSFGGDFTAQGEDRQTFLEERKLWENRQVIGNNLSEVAQIMTQVADEVFRYEPVEEKKKRQIIHALRDEGIIVEDICYIPQTENRKAVGLTMYTEQKNKKPSQEAADMISVLLDKHLQVSVTSPYFIEKNIHSFIFVEEPQYIVLSGFSRAVKENETVSGDNYAIIESEKGRVTVILSDGTGSGEEACRGSERVLDLMEKMLEAGYGMETAVNLVNAAVFARGEEQNHPTLDICDLDLYRGGCRFWKVGGAASFVKRHSRVEQISMGNLPLGVFQNIQPEPVSCKLQDGDYLVLMTDGVLDALGENNYEEAMYDAISQVTEQNPREIAEKLLQMVIRLSGGRILDDMTIIVIGVWENSGIT